jgi:hypothetical protein
VGKVLRPAALAGALGLAALVITACGGGDDSDPSPTPASATAEERAAAEPILKAASLPGENLPQGFTFQEDRFLTNEESAEEELDYAGAPTVEDLNRWGQILEYEVSYQREIPQTLTGATLSLQVTTALYRDSAGAEENFEFVRQQTSTRSTSRRRSGNRQRKASLCVMSASPPSPSLAWETTAWPSN